VSGGKNLLYFEPPFLFIMATEQTQKMVTVTSKAAEKIQEFMKEEAEAPEYLRVYVQGGGCSGLSLIIYKVQT
jgi:hypothetical protein